MNVNKVVSRAVFGIICCFLIISKTNAFNLCNDRNCVDGVSETENGKTLKYYNNDLFYCTQPNQPWPKDCSKITTFSERFSAAISYIINVERLTSEMTYNGAQRAISKFLFNNWADGHGNKLRQDWSLNSTESTIYKKAKKIFDNNTKIEFEQSSITFNNDGTATVKYKEVPSPFGISCAVTDGASFSIDKTQRKITIKSNDKDLTQSISLTCRTAFGYQPIDYYDCTGQELARLDDDSTKLYRYGPKTTIKSTPPKYKVRYSENGGEWIIQQPATIEKSYNQQFNLIEGEKYLVRNGYDFIGWRVHRSDNRWYYNFSVAGANYTCEESTCTYGWYGMNYNKDNSKKHKAKLLFPSKQNIIIRDKWVYLNDLSDDNKKKRRTSFTYTFYAQWKKKPSEKVDLTINKIYVKSDGSYGKVISPATFAIYSDSGCNNVVESNVVTSNGTKTIEVNKGTYYIKEIQAPNGYIIDETCRRVDVGEDGAEIDIENSTSCDTLLAEINSNYKGEERKKELINLFLQYDNYNKLLDFSYDINGQPNAACVAKDCSNKDTSVSCLAVSKGGKKEEFNENDLSCNDQRVGEGNSVGFCKTFIDLTNTLNISPEYTFTGKSGQFLIKQSEGQIRYYNSNNEIIVNANNLLNGSIEKICYYPNSVNYAAKPDLDVIVAFGNNDADKETDILPSTPSEIIESSQMVGSFNRISYKKNLSYDLNEVYLKRISGQVVSESLAAISGRGLIVKFNETKGNIPFEIKVIDSSSNINIKDDESCNFITSPEVIIYPDSKKQSDGTNPGQLEIEFRTIDTSKPFDRTPKSNWNSNNNWSLEDQNDLIKDNIINSVNSYGIKNNVKQTPKYKIKLTAEDIRVIREYNKEHPYDDYNFFCKNNICISSFLTSLRDGLNLGEAGTLTNKLLFERVGIDESMFTEGDYQQGEIENSEQWIESEETIITDDSEGSEELSDITITLPSVD